MVSVEQKSAWLWQNAENILIVVFFLTFSFNVRKIFLTPYSFLNGGFNEYMTISFGWADLLMIGTIIIYNIKLLISQFRQEKAPNSSLENVIRNKSSVIRNYYSNIVSRETLYLLIFLAWAGLSIFWSQYRPIAICRFLTLAEIVLFAAVAVKCLQNSLWLKIAVFGLVLNGLFQSLLGIAQFIHNASLGFHFLGESILGPNINGVAKIIISGERHIRAYGTFPHPNILAGFLIIPLFLIVAELIFRRFLSKSVGKHSEKPRVGTSATGDFQKEIVSYETIPSFIPTSFLWLSFLATGFGFFLTFSRSAFLGLFFGLLIYIFLIVYTRNLVQRFKNYYKFPVILTILLVLIIIALLNTTSFFSNQSLQERQLYRHVSYETISSSPIRGIGMGQFILNEHKLHPDLEAWQYQPVHNVYLLIFSELGIVGFILFTLLIASFLFTNLSDDASKENPLLTKYLFYCIVFSFLVISFFDHYLWDIKQGMLIFALPLIIYYGIIQQKRKLDREL
ncbi:MAG: O-antigen ligase family protein [Candidatus Moranbacteria bacterium]|nr:O-antigen ligase family protein [Candidatus Moranbacteria bacterium]